MKIVNCIPKGHQQKKETRHSKELRLFVESGAQYCQFKRIYRGVNSDTVQYRKAIRENAMPVKIYKRGDEIYGERIPSENVREFWQRRNDAIMNAQKGEHHE